MASVLKELIASQDLTNSTATYFTVGTGSRATVTKLTLCNHSSGSETVTIHFVASGDSAVDSNRIISDRAIADDETLDINVARHTLAEGSTIQAVCSSGSAVSIRASGQVTT